MRQQQCVCRFRRYGRQSRRSQKSEKGGIWSGHLFSARSHRVIFRSAAHRVLGRSGARQTVPRAELWGASQALGRVDEKTNIQLSIDAKYVTKGVTQTGELEYGPN